MQHGSEGNPNLTVALALAAGILAQSLAHHLRVPGIVVLLAAGVLLGPDVLGVVQPASLGTGLSTLVGFTVAIILFEGGMALDLQRLKRSSAPIQRLISIGALVTFVGATLASYFIMGLSVRLAVLFGSLVIVTGPTVVTPLLKRLRVRKTVSTVLEAEGVLIDPVGAIAALFALEVVLEPAAMDVVLSIGNVLLRLGLGSAVGAAAAFVISGLLRRKHWIPEGLENVFTLAMVLATYQIAEAMNHESGIAAVTAAGIFVRYLGAPSIRELTEFKEQLTVLGIGMLFVLLAADVRLDTVKALGVPGLLTVAALMFLVRPAAVAASTAGTSLTWRERMFISWIGPRGIVAAAVASLFGVRLEAAGMAGGEQLRAMVFLVIATTVVVAGLTGGPMAAMLGLKRPSNRGWVILGAHPLGRLLAKLLGAAGEEAVLIDVNPYHCRDAEEDGLRVLQGNGLKESTLGRAEIDSRRGAIGFTPNDEVNLLFVQKARELGKVNRLFIGHSGGEGGVTGDMIHHANAQVFGANDFDLERWISRYETGLAIIGRRRLSKVDKDAPGRAPINLSKPGYDLVLPLLVNRRGDLAPLGADMQLRTGDEIVFLLNKDDLEAAETFLEALGWVRADSLENAEYTSETTIDAPV